MSTEENTTEETEPVKSVGEMLTETPGSLTSGYIEACDTYDAALAQTYTEEERNNDELETAEKYAEVLKLAFEGLGFELTDENLAEQLKSISMALHYLAFQNGQVAAMMDSVGVAQRAYIVGLLNGIAASTAKIS